MQVVNSLQEILSRECPSIHAARLNALMANVSALIHGRKLTVTGLGRSPGRLSNTKHEIKQSARLIGNVHLNQERDGLYRAVAKQLLSEQRQPTIIIDWSDYTHNRSHILLRASVPVGGRALTLYEEVHPLKAYGNAVIQKAFLDKLHSFIATAAQPIVVTDAGFIGPWFAAVRAIGWHYVGRIRKNLLYRELESLKWHRCVDLYAKATRKARYLGPIELSRRKPLTCHLHVMKKKPKGRHEKTAMGRRSARKKTQDHITRETQPWLIVTSLDPETHTTKHVMQQYKTRMQIELGFRDIKNTRAGLALRESRSRSSERLANLLLVGMLACFCLWLIGRLAIQRRAHYSLQANTQRDRNVLSTFFIACQLVVNQQLPTGNRMFYQALALVRNDMLQQAVP